MKIIDWRAPKTGIVVHTFVRQLIVKWHNGHIEKLNFFRLENEKFYGKPRFEIIDNGDAEEKD